MAAKMASTLFETIWQLESKKSGFQMIIVQWVSEYQPFEYSGGSNSEHSNGPNHLQTKLFIIRKPNYG